MNVLAPITPVQPELDFAERSNIARRWVDHMRPDLPTLPYEWVRIAEHIAQNCRGEGNAQSAREIAQALGFPANGRKVRQLVSLFQDRCPHLILGAQGRGFFVPADLAASATTVRRTLFCQIRANAQRIRQLDRICRLHNIARVGTGPAALYHSLAAKCAASVSESSTPNPERPT
jgi:hypothetical protein